MLKFLAAASVAAMMVAGAGGASAAQMITFTDPAADGSFTGMFGNSEIPLGAFTDTYTFNLPSGFASWTVSSTYNDISPTNDVGLGAVTFNGASFQVVETGLNEYQRINFQPTINGSQTLVVNGTSGGNGTYSGTLSFARAPIGVPEPATWAMMLIGFGGAGSLLRARRRTATATA
jgi:hypothetical protein